MARLSAIFGSVRARWMRLARAIGDFQARLLLTLIYVVVMPPFALGARLLHGRFGAVPRGGATLWTERPPTKNALPAARRQY